MKRTIIATILSCICILCSAAWSDEYNYTYFGIQQGLCDEYVVSTYIDSDGYLWACTSNGLDRFDGHSFVHFNSKSNNPETKLKSNFINGIAEDHVKNMWVVSSNGLMKIDKKARKVINPEEMGRFSGVVSQPIVGIVSLDRETFWILMDRSVAHVLLDREGNISDINVFPTLLDGNRMMSVTRDMIYIGSLKGMEAYSISSNGELLPYDDASMAMISDIRNVSYVLSSGSYLWIGTEDGLFQYNSKEKALSTYRHSETDDQTISDNHITCLAFDESGDLLIGTAKGIDKLSRTGRFSHMTQDRPNKSINTNYVNNIKVSEDGTIWVSTLVGGLNRVSPKPAAFQEMLSVDQGISNIVSCSMEDRDGNLLVGILGKGLGIKMAGQSDFKIYSLKDIAGTAQNDIFSIEQDNDGNYWICTRFDGLVLLERKNLEKPSFRIFRTSNSTVPDDHIYDIEYDKARNGLWASTTTGLFFMETTSRVARRIDLIYDADAVQRFYCLYLDNQGRLWGGGYGLIVVDTGTGNEVRNSYQVDFFPRLSTNVSDSRERISSITQSPSGRIFIASNTNGIYEAMQDGSFRNYPLTNSQSDAEQTSPSLSKIIPDSSDNIWVSSTNGIYHVNAGTGITTLFTMSDGLPSANCYINSGCSMSYGKIAFGTNNGLVIFDAPLNMPSPAERKVTLSAIRNGGNLNLWNNNRELHIYPSDPTFEISMSSMDLSHSERVFYAYTINDDPGWRISTSNKATFSNLKPGKYTFYTICTYPDQHWSTDLTSIKIIVHPSLIQRPLFWILIALVFLALAGALIANVFIRKAKTQKELKQQVEEKTADLRKAMDDIVESKNSIERQNVILEEQKAKLEEYSASMEKANREKLMLYTNLTHEFKTPLSLIMGPVSELSETCTDEAAKPTLGIISRNAKYLLSLVNQILDLRKVDSGKINVKRDTLSISSFLSLFSMDFSRAFQSRGIEVTTNLRLIGNSIYSDSDILFKIVSNLMSNASKYTPDGGKVTMNLAQFRRGSEGKIMQYISVTNSGSYIKKEELDKVFDCFYKSEGNPIYGQQAQGSTGIGLYLVRNLVNALGGHITVKSSPKTGTSFRLYFPAELVKSDADQAIVDSSEMIDDIPTLLLVEDNDDMRAYIKGILGSRFNVKEATNGAIGYEIAKQTIPDFIISDLMMPVCDGLQFCKMVREDSNLSHIPFMMLTALADDDTRLNSYRQGVSAFLVKPFSKDMLLARIDNILNDKKQQQEELSFDLENSYATVNIDRSDKAFMEQLMNVLKENYTDPEFSIPKLQTLMCMSMTPFYKKVSSLTGLTPAMLIRRYRLQTAKTLMENNLDKGINVSEIAYMVGFNDPKYFSKCFSKEYHIKPSELLQDKSEGK